MKRLPAEWESQRFVQLTWPHEASDWASMLDAVNECFAKLALAILRFEPLLVVCKDAETVMRLLKSAAANGGAKELEHRLVATSELPTNTVEEQKGVASGLPSNKVFIIHDGLHPIRFIELASNDTWARDHGGITVFEDGKRMIYDYAFNGWGKKFDAELDNALTHQLFELGELGVFMGNERVKLKGDNRGEYGKLKGDERNEFGKLKANERSEFLKGELGKAIEDEAEVPGYRDCLDFVLEGGSLESDGNGTLLTTSECLLSEFRNPAYTKEMIERRLKTDFGLSRVLWLNHGYLEGDDTDSHIDTLARFCDRDTIAYVRCDDPVDAHYEALQKMEDELRQFRTFAGKPYRMIPLPMADVAYDEEGYRLPATYANFLIVNGAILMPTYGSDIKDRLARNQLQQAFPDRQIINIDCRVLIEQHGSLHCVTMQYH